MASNHKIKKLSQQIIKNPKNLQYLPQLISLFKQNSSTSTNGILWLKRVFLHYDNKISFLNTNLNTNKAAIWMKQQYLLFESILIKMFYSLNVNLLCNDSLKCLLFFAEFRKNTNLFQQILIILLFKSNLTKELQNIFSNFIIIHFDFIKTFTKICHLTENQLLTKYYTITKYINDDTSNLLNSFKLNTLNILLMLSQNININSPPNKKRKLNNNPNKSEPVSVQNYLSISWLNYLSFSGLSTDIYYKILTHLESDIFPIFIACDNVLLLSDFLTDSYNIGGEISLLSLRGLFLLINNYNLDYPDFYSKLYSKLHLNIFFSKNSAKFFELLSMFLLKSSYIPQYLVIAFMKRLSRMSLFSSPHSIVFILNIIHDLLIKYPAVRYVVDRSKRTNKGLMDAMKLHKQQKINYDNDIKMDDVDDDNDKLIGNDPFDYNCLDPHKCGAEQSSLWEIKSLINHFEYKTSGHCFKTITHFKQRDYKRVQIAKCHMFEYHKLLNYYFIKNKWNMKSEYDDDIYEKNDKNDKDKNNEKKQDKKYNINDISVDRKDHLFADDSIFTDLWSM